MIDLNAYACFLKSSPLLILLESLLSFLLFGFRFSNERMRKKYRPVLTFAWVLIEKALQEILEIRRHVVRVLYWILNNQIDESINRIRVERRLANEEFVENHT